MEIMRRLVQEEEGQGMVEYALIIALVAVALIAGLEALTGGISAAFDAIVTELPAAE